MSLSIKNLFLIVVPGAISISRHSNVFSIKNNVVPMLFIELAPFMVFSIIESGDILLPIYTYLLLSVFYEVGYVVNDVVTVLADDVKTLRNTIDNKYTRLFILYRCSLVVFISSLLYIYNYSFFEHYLLFSLLISVIFIIHNRPIELKYKIFTFISLNSLKLVFRLFGIGNVPLFLLASAPFLIIKTLHYLGHKKCISFEKLRFGDLVVPVYAAFSLITIIVNWSYLPVTLAYLINHKKRDWLNVFRRRFLKLGG